MKIYLFLSILAAITIKISFCDGDRVIYAMDSQMDCTEVTRNSSLDCGWKAGLDVDLDQILVDGDIIAYQILWSNGTWSKWYVTGVNDIDWVFNEEAEFCTLSIFPNSLRRVWSYFFDHTHKYILCKSKYRLKKAKGFQKNQPSPWC